MKTTKRSTRNLGFVLGSALALALTGCTTYVEQEPARTVYASPPSETPATSVEPPVVVINTENDFYEPLSPYGSWVIVGSYGRCWKPARVETGWRPYCDGHWQRTEAGWYWASNEPWGWATYHYGRWDWSVEFGWIWVPHTQWAPAWVSWRQGAGYVGWAPLPPSARIGTRGRVGVRETALAPHAFVFVSEQRLLEPVRSTTVIVNNTTVINQTVNITKVQVVNKTVINEGPRPEIIERRSGRKIEAVPVQELRRSEETEVASRQRNIPSTIDRRGPPSTRTATAPGNTIPVHEPRQVERPTEARKEPQQQPARPETRTPSRGEARQEAKPGTTIPPRTALQADQPTAITRQPQSPANRNELRGPGAVEPSEKPGPSRTQPPLGNARGRALERPNVKSEPQKPATVRKSVQPTTNKPAAKARTPIKGKPAANERESKNENTKVKKGEE